MERFVFQFKNYDVPVEIAGHQFTMDCSADTKTYIKETSAGLRELADLMGKKEKTVADAQKYCCGIIDHLLGDGAAAKVLDGRSSKSRTSDLMDICAALFELATKFRSNSPVTSAPISQEE